jgi:hypothetical protein
MDQFAGRESDAPFPQMFLPLDLPSARKQISDFLGERFLGRLVVGFGERVQLFE